MIVAFSARSFFIVCMVCGSYLTAEEKMQMLSAEEARSLAYEALPTPTRKLPGLTLIAGQDQTKPNCLTFDVLWANPGPGSFHVGFWSVDMRTGEVWRPILCERVSNRSIRILQNSIRKRLGITNAQRQAALMHSPCCTPDPYAK